MKRIEKIKDWWWWNKPNIDIPAPLKMVFKWWIILSIINIAIFIPIYLLLTPYLPPEHTTELYWQIFNIICFSLFSATIVGLWDD